MMTTTGKDPGGITGQTEFLERAKRASEWCGMVPGRVSQGGLGIPKRAAVWYREGGIKPVRENK